MKTLICSVYEAGGDDPFLSLLPVGVGSLVAVLRNAGFAAKAVNFYGLSFDKIRKILAVERPDLLGISVMTHNRHNSIRLAELTKELNPACYIVFGGPHATHRCREILSKNSSVDAVVLGEGEETLLELAELLSNNNHINSLTTSPLNQGGHRGLGGHSGLAALRGLAFRDGDAIVVTAPRPPLPDLDALPPAFTGFESGININIHNQLEFLISSRGCPAACTFCSSPHFWGKSLRFRSPRNMVEEIRTIRTRYGLIYFSIRDDTFTSDRKRVIEFCRLLLEERLFILWNCQSRVSAVDEEMLLWMRRAGCDCIQYGVESGSPAILKALGKRITPEQIIKASTTTRRVGIRLSIYLMTGIPGETEIELRESLKLLKSVKADDGQVSPLAYYPGTRLFDTAVEQRDVPADLFERSPAEALYVRNDPFVLSATHKLLTQIEQCAPNALTVKQDSAAARLRTGYCHASNISVGELLAESGDFTGAEKQYQEIVRHEPDNPWGWLLLGELWRDTGQSGKALRAFRRLAELVPTHLPVWDALADLCRISGDLTEARRCRDRARKLVQSAGSPG